MADFSVFKIAYRLLSWSTLAGLVLTLVLILHKSPAPDVPYDHDAAARVEQKFAAADQTKAAGESSQVQLDRTELNSYLKDNLALEGQTQPPEASTSPAQTSQAQNPSSGNANPAGLGAGDQATLEQVQSTVKDVRIDMDGDLVKAYVVFDFHGKEMSLELAGHLRTQDGYIRFQPVAGKLGSLPLPQSALDSAVEKLMASPENRDKLKLPPNISDIQIVNGQAVITYK
jgi:hypothetical protein